MNRFFVIVPFFFFLYHLCSAAAVFNAADNYAINCGSSGTSAATDGRKWIGDVGSKSRLSTFSIESKGKLISSSAVDSLLSLDRIPFATAQVSRSDFTYTFKLNPGPKFIRLHFHPSSYASFKRYASLFTVKAGSYTLLNDFSPSITADASGLKAVTKEFCIHVRENQPLRITFSPSPDNNAFAFINGIEVVSMPANLYYSNRIPIDETIALEATHRLNIGGKSIPSVEDTGMFREWLNDSSYLLEMESTTVLPIATTLRIRYGKVPSYIAPQKIYQTSWSIDSYVEVKKSYTFTWKLLVDTGFRYLVRLHFCELDYEIKEIGQKKFSISIDNKTVDGEGDLMKWGGEIGFAFYRDYMFLIEGDVMEGKHDVFISIHPHLNNELVMVDAILKGMEVLKLSNPDNNLAGVNPIVLPTYDAKMRGSQYILLFSFTGVVILVSYIFLHRKKEVVGDRNIVGDRKFSLSEIRKATKNFSQEKVLRSDEFGTVYEGAIDKGTTMVEVRRLRCMQKEEEFTMVTKILPNVRHENLIRLIGYCREKQEIILVYEHMVKGMFSDHIFPSEKNMNSPTLPWETRLQVCAGAARGLDYLHTTHNTIHRDVKSASILLNSNFIPKVSDFRLCRTNTTTNDVTSTHISTLVKGTIGYLDPEYFSNKRLTKKSDVYSFGVVLWEVLCGRPALAKTRKEECNLAKWAQQCYKEGDVDNIIDPAIKHYISRPCLLVFTAIANKCIHTDSTMRPKMAEVAAFLEKALEFQIWSDTVNMLDVDELINRIGIDTDQSVISVTLERDVLKPDDIGPYSPIIDLIMVLEIYRAFIKFFQYETLLKVERRVLKTLREFEENIKLTNTSEVMSDVNIHPLTVDVLGFMERLSLHGETINSFTTGIHTTPFEFNHYFESLISALNTKLEKIAEPYQQSLKLKFLKCNRDYIVITVQRSNSFVNVTTVERVRSIIFADNKPTWLLRYLMAS